MPQYFACGVKLGTIKADGDYDEDSDRSLSFAIATADILPPSQGVTVESEENVTAMSNAYRIWLDTAEQARIRMRPALEVERANNGTFTALQLADLWSSIANFITDVDHAIIAVTNGTVPELLYAPQEIIKEEIEALYADYTTASAAMKTVHSWMDEALDRRNTAAAGACASGDNPQNATDTEPHVSDSDDVKSSCDGDADSEHSHGSLSATTLLSVGAKIIQSSAAYPLADDLPDDYWLLQLQSLERRAYLLQIRGRSQGMQ